MMGPFVKMAPRMWPFCATLILFHLFALPGATEAAFNHTFLPSDFVLVEQGKDAILQMNLTGITQTLQIEMSSSDVTKFTLEQERFRVNPIYETVLYSNGSTGDRLRADGVQTIQIEVRGVSFGIRVIDFVVRSDLGLVDPNLQIDSFVVKVIRPPTIIVSVFNYVMLVWLMLSYVTMGVKLEWKVIRDKLRRPFGVVIGALCQFIVMPGIAALLARVLNLEPTASVALIIVGSCPGGWLSNIFTLLLDCDLVLSLTMTFCSTVISLGMMPLNLFIYATPYARDNSDIAIPFAQIFISIITLVVPLLIGTFIAHRYPKAAKWFQRLLKPLAVLLITVAFVVGIWANYFAFSSPAELYLSAIILPCTAGLLGFFISKLTCLSNRSAITIAIETGSQNSLLATSVIALSFPQPEADLMTRVPVLFVLFTFLQGFFLTSIYVVTKRCPGRFELPEDVDGDVDDEPKHDDEAVGHVKGKHSKGNDKTNYKVPSRIVSTVSENPKPWYTLRTNEKQHDNELQKPDCETKRDISSRIVGYGSEQNNSKSKTNRTRRPWSFSKSRRDDSGVDRDSTTTASYLNRSFDYQAERPGPSGNMNSGSTRDIESLNTNARQIYL